MSYTVIPPAASLTFFCCWVPLKIKATRRLYQLALKARSIFWQQIRKNIQITFFKVYTPHVQAKKFGYKDWFYKAIDVHSTIKEGIKE